MSRILTTNLTPIERDLENHRAQQRTRLTSTVVPDKEVGDDHFDDGPEFGSFVGDAS